MKKLVCYYRVSAPASRNAPGSGWRARKPPSRCTPSAPAARSSASTRKSKPANVPTARNWRRHSLRPSEPVPRWSSPSWTGSPATWRSLQTLMESGVDFVCCDNPHANRLTIHILAAVAEDEARRISERTKAALAAAKRRGVKLGAARPECRNLSHAAQKKGARAAGQAVKQKADEAYRDLRDLFAALRPNVLTTGNRRHAERAGTHHTLRQAVDRRGGAAGVPEVGSAGVGIASRGSLLRETAAGHCAHETVGELKNSVQ